MTEILIKYILPMTIGYIMFVGIAGRLWPFRKPQQLSLRPAWFLGIWTGIAVALSLGLMLSMTYYLSPTGIRELMPPTVSLLVALLLPGFVAFFIYRNVIQNRIRAQATPVNLVALDAIARQKSAGQQVASADTLQITSPVTFETPVAAPVLATSPASTSRPGPIDNSLNDTSIDGSGIDAPPPTVAQTDPGISVNPDFDRLAEFDATVAGEEYLADESLYHSFYISDEEQTMIDDNSVALVSTAPDEADAIYTSVDREQYEFHFQRSHQLASESLRVTSEQQTEIVQTDIAAADQSVPAALRSAITSAQAEQQHRRNTEFLQKARKVAREEYDRRLQAEQRLAQLRRSLTRLEAKLNPHFKAKTEEQIKLEALIKNQQTALHEADQRVAEEQAEITRLVGELSATRKQLTQAETNVRNNISARSKALQAARKAVNFARNANTERSRVEAELEQLRNALKAQTRTTSSLINALEKERTVTRETASKMAARMVIQDRAIQSMRTVPATTQRKRRLIQKIAKPRIGADTGSSISEADAEGVNIGQEKGAQPTT